jgi:hypothetical protein
VNAQSVLIVQTPTEHITIVMLTRLTLAMITKDIVADIITTKAIGTVDIQTEKQTARMSDPT